MEALERTSQVRFKQQYTKSRALDDGDLLPPVGSPNDRWSLAQEKYQLWLAVPSSQRPIKLRTRADFARVSGIDEDLLCLWEQSAGWWDATFAIARRVVGRQLADILEATAREAIKGSVPAQKLAYQVMGVAAEKVEHQVNVDEDRLVVILHGTVDDLTAATVDAGYAQGRLPPVELNTPATNEDRDKDE
uniref:Uncharacterized protein n=1 Tax=viral metagenome TaxID=1070528 RepID=A0A6M3L7M5_9ZZZZ